MSEQIVFFLVLAWCLVGLCAITVFLLRFMASALSLIQASNAASRDMGFDPTFGWLGLWRVLRHENNREARAAMARSFLWFVCAFTVTMAPLILMLVRQQ